MTDFDRPTAGARRSRGVRTIVLAALSSALPTACSVGDARVADSAAHVADSTRLARADFVARARQDSANRAQPGYVVDSILPVEEEIRRFQAEVRDTAHALRGGARSRDLLVGRFVRALEARDTAALAELHVTRAEFAWLVFPTSPSARPPLRTKPAVAWMQTVARSDRGITRALTRLGGRPLAYLSYRCEGKPEPHGENRVHGPCTVRRVQAPGDTVEQRLFGAIVERGGRFKLLSFANDL